MLKTLHGSLGLPTFFPDGTSAVVRSVDSRDLDQAKVEGMVTSTFHLLVHGVGSDLHSLMNWNKPILTDSGGFQVYSLLRDNPKLGQISDQGFKFLWNGQKITLTPESSIDLQLKLGADILICLDQCTDPEMPREFQEEAVELTIKWAKRCKEEFDSFDSRPKANDSSRPLLFAVIQGGNEPDLREYCAKELIKIGFDGYCYGGVPIDATKKLLEDILNLTAAQMPDDKPKYALGVGKPEDIVKCFKMGYSIFDCVIPTREARHKRLYVHKSSIINHESNDWYETVSINSNFANDQGPISKDCDCHTCQNFSRAYLYHLFKIRENLALRLATIHNLRFYSVLMERLKTP